MPIFEYEAMREPGSPVRGEIEAENPNNATTILLGRGYHILRLEETSGAGSGMRMHVGGFGGLKRRDLVRITRDMANLLKAGLPLAQILFMLAHRAEDKKWQGVLRGLRARIEDGQTFSEALGTFPLVFDAVYVNLVDAGERSGNLVEVLTRIAGVAEKQEDIRARVKMAMVYPGVMLTVGAVTVFVLLTLVVPMFVKVFKDTGQALPLPTYLLVTLSTFMQRWWYLLVLGAAAVTYVGSVSLRTTGRRFASAVALRIPVIGALVRKGELASFCQTLATLLNSGLPIVTALSVTAATLRNVIFAETVRAMTGTIRDGGLLSDAVAAQPLFPPMVVSIVSVGERTGELGNALQQLAEECERDVDRQVKVVMTLLEPVMIVMLGVVVGFIVLSVLLPIFELGDAIQP